MNAADIKDVMGDVPIQAHAPPVKKQKVIEKRPGKSEVIRCMKLFANGL